MPLVVQKAIIKITADTNDILSTIVGLRSAGPGTYTVRVCASAANDATITINDGSSDVVSAEAIATAVVGSTSPNVEMLAFAPVYTIRTTPKVERLRIDIIDGSAAEVLLEVVKIA